MGVGVSEVCSLAAVLDEIDSSLFSRSLFCCSFEYRPRSANIRSKRSWPTTSGCHLTICPSSQLPLLPTVMSGAGDNLEGQVTYMRLELIGAEKLLRADPRTDLRQHKIRGLRERHGSCCRSHAGSHPTIYTVMPAEWTCYHEVDAEFNMEASEPQEGQQRHFHWSFRSMNSRLVARRLKRQVSS